MATDLGPVLSAATQYGDDREAEGRAAAEAEGRVALDALRAEYDAYREAHPDVKPEPEVPPTPPRSVLLGMSTDDYDARVRETGPVEAHRIFVPGFNVSSLVSKLREAHERGVVPYWSLKFNTTWQAAASGQDDARFRDLGNALADLDFPTFGSFHHEPRGGGISTPQQLVDWSRANVRAMNIVKPLAGPQHKLGTTDNGFPWGVKAKAAALNDAELAVYYTPALLNACDFLGGDFYDGKTNTNPGEPAAVKMAKFESWAARVAPGKPLAVGEWNAVLPADIYAAWDVLKAGPWAIACIFNSAANNRQDLPTDGSLGNPPSWVLRGDRLAAFRDLLSRN
ncbi:hypothetical protein [Nocardioides terrigena]|uniref:hypothetical protein n=1 Tax=Nocardioides terrigena TaxID=424797 RepID=UPI000D31B0CD|nr:hypothetical protein [Nocardioides terrigena]